MYKYFQTGVESNIAITNTNWKVRIGHTSYYNPTTWSYEPAYSCDGASSWITKNSTHVSGVGGSIYTGVNRDPPSNDVVTWKYNGTTLNDDTPLWSGYGPTDIVVYYPFARNPSWNDDFNDNAMSPVYWTKLQVNGGAVDETSNKLRLTIPSGTGQACAGYVTKYADTIDNRFIEVDVPEFDSLDEMIIMVATSQITGSDPYSLSNWYRCLKTRYTAGDYDWYVQKKVSGTASTLEQWGTSGGTGKLKIAVDDGWIRFYEGDNLRYAEPYTLATTSVYIYIYTSTLRSRNSGVDYMDDFAYTSYDSRYSKDDFTDTSYGNRWDWVSGSATVESGKFKMYDNGEQKTEATYNDFRCVAAKVTTEQYGSEHWHVAWLVAKYINWDNQVYGLIWPDGTVELAVRYGGDQHGWATASGSVSNPMSEHNWEIVLSGSHAVMLVDGVPKQSATDSYFSYIHGERVAVFGNNDNCVAKYDDVEVID